MSRLTVSEISRDFAAQFSFERGVLRTARDILLRPHHLIASYVEGPGREIYSNVAGFFFLTLSALFFLRGWLPTSLDEETLRVAEQLPGFVTSQQFLTLWWVAVVPIVAVCFRFMLRAWGFNFAECLATAGFLASQTFLISLVLQPLVFLGVGAGVSTILPVGYRAVTLFLMGPRRSLGVAAMALIAASSFVVAYALLTAPLALTLE